MAVLMKSIENSNIKFQPLFIDDQSESPKDSSKSPENSILAQEEAEISMNSKATLES